MADFGIKPDIALGYQGLKQQSVNDLIGTAKGVMEFKRLSELYPALIEQTKAQSRGAVATAQSQELANRGNIYGKIAQAQFSMYADPLIEKAEQLAKTNQMLSKDEHEKVIKMVHDTAFNLTKSLGIPWESKNPSIPSGKEMSEEYINTAINNPGGLRTLYDRKIRSLFQPTEQTAMLHGEITFNSQGQPVIVNKAMGTVSPAKIGPGGNVPPAGRPALGVDPRTPAPGSVPAPGGVTAADMTRAPGTPSPTSPGGFQFSQALPAIRFAKRDQGNITPILADEAAAREGGQTWYNNQLAARDELSTARRDVDQVISAANRLHEGVLPSVGFWATLKKSATELQGDPEYQLLNKSLAALAIRTSSALGGASANTQGGQSLVQASLGTETYDPRVLKKIAQNVGADLTQIDLRANAADQFMNKYGAANMSAFRTAWANHANPTVFKAINIMRDVDNPDEANKLVQGLMKDMGEKKRKQFTENYRAIKSMVSGEFGPYLRTR